ncbi:putative acyl-CoA dehydrogenase 6 [Armadillidium vulgare]|nr:putative acyl-CoA dehydrogenase 6 [Armadillidium vulgare]
MLSIQKLVRFSMKNNLSTNVAAWPKSLSAKSFSNNASTNTNTFNYEDVKQLQDSLQKLIDVHINPFVEEWEAAKMYPAHKVLKKLGEAGFLGISYPVAAVETYGKISCGAIPMSIGVHSEMTTPALARFGSEYLKKEFLVPTIAGDVVACVGSSEPQAGSDVAAIKTTAKKSGDDLIINGQKMWITNGIQADWMCLLANTSQGSPYKNKSLICLPMKTPGVHVGKNIEKIGMDCSDTAEIFFEDVRIPAKNIIGEEGRGFIYQMLQFQQERLVGLQL